MKEIFTHHLREGMVIANDVMTKGGQLVLEKGKVLSRQSIMRLSFYNIKSVMIKDDTSAAANTGSDAANTEANAAASAVPKTAASALTVPKETDIPQKITTPQLKVSQKFQSFQIDHSIVLSTIKTSFESFVNTGAPLDTQQLIAKVQELFDSCKTSLELFNMLHNMHSSDDSIYAHSLNVALICRQIGKWLKVNTNTLNTLTLCGILHDIGKLKIPTEILNKPGKYTDEEFQLVKMHTQYGYELLDSLALDEHIKYAALSHHERCDGSGYPLGTTQDDTDDYAMLVAIADVYDAMTTARSYRAPLCPFQVIWQFEQEGLQKYKPKYILTFLGHVASTYQNHRVLLSDGRSATVVMINQHTLSRPIVRLDDNTCIDLSLEHDLCIQAVL